MTADDAESYMSEKDLERQLVIESYSYKAPLRRKCFGSILAKIDTQDSLGLMYANGRGVPQNYAQAVAWWREAAAQGSARAQTFLGAMYFMGRGVPQDFVAVYALYNLSASLDSTSGNPAAHFRTDVTYLMTPEQITAGQALTREMQRIGVIKALDEYSNGGTQ